MKVEKTSQYSQQMGCRGEGDQLKDTNCRRSEYLLVVKLVEKSKKEHDFIVIKTFENGRWKNEGLELNMEPVMTVFSLFLQLE